MGLGPDHELFVLMECHESPFGLGRPEDYRWHAERPGESPYVDLIRELEDQGHVILGEVWDADAQRMQMQAQITPAGRRRMDELVHAGVKPAAGWL